MQDKNSGVTFTGRWRHIKRWLEKIQVCWAVLTHKYYTVYCISEVKNQESVKSTRNRIFVMVQPDTWGYYFLRCVSEHVAKVCEKNFDVVSTDENELSAEDVEKWKNKVGEDIKQSLNESNID